MIDFKNEYEIDSFIKELRIADINSYFNIRYNYYEIVLDIFKFIDIKSFKKLATKTESARKTGFNYIILKKEDIINNDDFKFENNKYILQPGRTKQSVLSITKFENNNYFAFMPKNIVQILNDINNLS